MDAVKVTAVTACANKRSRTMTSIDDLKAICLQAENIVSGVQDELAYSAAALANTVGPMAAAHRLAELAQEMFDLSKDKERPLRPARRS
jgi:hypothetical protein